MRIYDTPFFKKKNEPNIGDVRILTLPAIFPITIEDDCRWFEIVKILQILVKIHHSHQDPTQYEWVDVRFLNK